MILRALPPLVVGVAQGQSIYTSYIKQKSMQCQWCDGVSGEGGDEVSGCKGRDPQNFSSVFIPPLDFAGHGVSPAQCNWGSSVD